MTVSQPSRLAGLGDWISNGLGEFSPARLCKLPAQPDSVSVQPSQMKASQEGARCSSPRNPGDLHCPVLRFTVLNRTVLSWPCPSFAVQVLRGREADPDGAQDEQPIPFGPHDRGSQHLGCISVGHRASGRQGPGQLQLRGKHVPDDMISSCVHDAIVLVCFKHDVRHCAAMHARYTGTQLQSLVGYGRWLRLLSFPVFILDVQPFTATFKNFEYSAYSSSRRG